MLWDRKGQSHVPRIQEETGCVLWGQRKQAWPAHLLIPALAPPCSDPIHCSAEEADPQELQGGFL